MSLYSYIFIISLHMDSEFADFGSSQQQITKQQQMIYLQPHIPNPQSLSSSSPNPPSLTNNSINPTNSHQHHISTSSLTHQHEDNTIMDTSIADDEIQHQLGVDTNQYISIKNEEKNEGQRQRYESRGGGRMERIFIFFMVIILVFVFFAIGVAVVGLWTAGSGKEETKLVKNDGSRGTITAIIAVSDTNQTKLLDFMDSFIKSTKSIHSIHSKVFLPFSPTIQTLSKLTSFKPQIIFTSEPFSFLFLDKLISKIKTQYYFFTTTEWQILDNKFMQFSIDVLQKRNNIGQVFVDFDIRYGDNQEYVRAKGFDFGPALHRVKDWRDGSGFGVVAGSDCWIEGYCKDLISDYYFARGLTILAVNKFNIKKQIKKVQINRIREQKTTVQQDKNEYELDKNANEQSSTVNPNLTIAGHLKQLQQIMDGKAPKVIGVEQLSQIKQLPFCVLLKQVDNILLIEESLRLQNYRNHYTIKISSFSTYSQIRAQLLSSSNPCPKNSILLFLQSPIQASALSYLNNLHQTNLAYLTYSKSQSQKSAQKQYYYEIHTVLSRVFMLLQDNDFFIKNAEAMEANRLEWAVVGILKLGRGHALQIDRQKVIKPSIKPFLAAYSDSNDRREYADYTKLLSLSQDMMLDVQDVQKFKQSNMAKRRSPRSKLTQQQMQIALQRAELPYLPQNTSIEQLEYQQLKKIYNISKQSPSSQLIGNTRFCLTIISRNNLQNNRYKKLLLSVAQQNYRNYHIVFIDDNSIQANLQKHRQFIEEQKLSLQNIRYIQNKERKYATYNIVHAAFNYCGKNDVQVVIDGDDQLIGKYVLSVFDAVYTKNPQLWVVYSNYKSSLAEYGRSIPFQSEADHILLGKRAFVSNMGPIRTWRVKLIWAIPISHHKMQNGQWLDTVYDDALQHPLIQLSTPKRSYYINQIFYNYNTRYGDNDDSSGTKINHRLTTYRYILTLPPLQPIINIDDVERNEQIFEQFKNDRNNGRFKEIL